MKGVARSLSCLLLCFCFLGGLSAQETIVVQKKYDFSVGSNIFSQDTTLSERKTKIPMVYNYHHLALFCKVEEKVAQKSKLNMRFRLGSLDYVNYLEQKPNWQLSVNQY